MLRDGKLHCIIVDDDPDTHTVIRNFLKDSRKAVVTASFYKCTDFLQKMYHYEFDVVFLDCLFPNDTKMGVDVAFKLKEIGKRFIFISAVDKLFIEACRMMGAMDVMPKPLTEQRLLESIEYAYGLIIGKEINLRKHILVHIKELRGETNIDRTDILYASAETKNPRNKKVLLKHDTNYTFFNWKFSEILNLSDEFTMANKLELVSYSIVENIFEDYLTLKQDENSHIPKHIPLSPAYRNSFKREFH